MADISASIMNGTMSDDASVAELFKRQKHLAADSSLTDSARLQGQAIFNTALFTDLAAAMEAATPVVSILRRTIEAIGAIYLQNEKREAVPHVADAASDDAELPDLDLQESISKQAMREPSSMPNADDGSSDDNSTADRISAAVAARQKRRLATHGAQKRMSAAAGVVKALNRTSRGPKPTFTGADNPALNNKLLGQKAHARKTHQQLASKHLNAQAPPGSIVKLKMPKSYFQEDVMALQNEKPAKAKFRRRRKSKVKSEEFVTSDHDDSENETPEADIQRSPRSTKTADTQDIMTPDLDEAEAEEDDSDADMEDVGEPVPSTKQSRTAKSSTSTKSRRIFASEEESHDEDDNLLVVVKPTSRATTQREAKSSTSAKPRHASASDEDDDEVWQDEDSEAQDIDKPAPRQRKTNIRTSATYDFTTSPEDTDVEETQAAQSTTTRSTSPSATSAITVSTSSTTPPPLPTNPAPKATYTYTFPPPPALEPRKRAPFHLGATIALENIVEDHELNPDDTLLELIHELDDNKPTVDDWERKTILAGGEWVCDVLRKFAAVKSRGKGKGKEKEERAVLGIDVGGLVGGLEEWVGMGMGGE